MAMSSQDLERRVVAQGALAAYTASHEPQAQGAPAVVLTYA